MNISHLKKIDNPYTPNFFLLMLKNDAGWVPGVWVSKWIPWLFIYVEINKKHQMSIQAWFKSQKTSKHLGLVGIWHMKNIISYSYLNMHRISQTS